MKKKDDSIFLNYKEQIYDAIEDLKTKGRRHRQIPNLLTLMRLISPCVIIPSALVGNVPLTIWLSLLFGLTDRVDGWIANKWDLTSELGANLDAVTDKVFASTLLIVSSLTNPILLCNLALEGGIAGINICKKLKNKPVKSSFVGKVKTWFLFSLAAAGIVSLNWDITNILNALLVSTTAMQVFTIGSYLFPISTNKKLESNEQDEITSSITSNTNDFEEKEFKKEKKLEIDNSVAKKQTEKNESLKQLKTMREVLVSEKTFLEEEKSKTDIQTTYQKKKTDDLQK